MAFAMNFSEAVQNVFNFKADIHQDQTLKDFLNEIYSYICIYFICIYLYVYI